LFITANVSFVRVDKITPNVDIAIKIRNKHTIQKLYLGPHDIVFILILYKKFDNIIIDNNYVGRISI
jgi:hypothetical protein